MRELASRGQLRLAFLRWAAVTVPFILLLGIASARLVSTGDDNRWFAALVKPPQMPPDWVFPVVWTLLYILMGLALAIVINARGSRLRGPAILLFALQMMVNIIWAPLFFGGHQVFWAEVAMVVLFALALGTTILFGGIRTVAAWLMVPYLAWLVFAGMLFWRIDQLNPGAETMVPPAFSTRIIL